MDLLARTLRENRLLWLLVLVPLPLAVHAAAKGSDTILFSLSVAAIVPLAALLSLATEQVAARTGDALGGLLNATLGNLTELVIALAALRAGEYVLVKASLAGAIVTNTLFMTGAAFLLGGLKHHVQEFNRSSARLHLSLLLLASFALLIPSAIGQSEARGIIHSLSLGTSLLLLAAYGLGLVFSLGTHRAYFDAAAHDTGDDEERWPLWLALAVLAGTTVMVALVSEVFVASVEGASRQLGLSPAFVGFVVVALVGGAAEMTSAFSAAMRDRLDLSVAIAFGSATQIAMFVAPVLVLVSYAIGPEPMTLEFWPWAVVMMFIALATASLLTAGGRSAWFLGVLMLMVYSVFALTLYLLPAPA